MMKKDVISTMRKLVSVLLLVLACGYLLWVGAWTVLIRLHPWSRDPIPAPDLFPATEIVYGEETDLGFINADGSNRTTMPFLISNKSWGFPFIAGDPQVLVVTNDVLPWGDIYVAHPGKVAVDCGWYGIARLAADGYHILLETFDGQEKYLPEDCGTGNPPEKVYPGVIGALSPDEQYSAEARWSEPGEDMKPSLILHNLKTGEERIIGVGDFPVWSRDGQWLAYTGADGIYVVQPKIVDAEPKRLVTLESPEPSIGVPVYKVYSADPYYPPVASWSPDGKWLVYHEYHPNLDAEFPAQYSIVKVNVDTGKTIKLVDGGLFPYWRWPVEEP